MSILAVDRPAGSGRSRHRGLLTPLMIVRPAVGGSPVIRAVVLLRWSPHRRAPPLVRVRETDHPGRTAAKAFAAVSVPNAILRTGLLSSLATQPDQGGPAGVVHGLRQSGAGQPGHCEVFDVHRLVVADQSESQFVVPVQSGFPDLAVQHGDPGDGLLAVVRSLRLPGQRALRPGQRPGLAAQVPGVLDDIPGGQHGQAVGGKGRTLPPAGGESRPLVPVVPAALVSPRSTPTSMALTGNGVAWTSTTNDA